MAFLLVSKIILTNLMSILMIGHIKVGQLINSFMLTKLAMLDTQAVKTYIETFSYSISPKRIFKASADWKIISGVMI